jgi:hypothetical protein
MTAGSSARVLTIAGLSSVSGRHDAGRFDHNDRGSSRRTRAVDDPLGHAARLMLGERDRVGTFDIDQQLTVEDQKELVLVVVLVPMKISVDHTESDESIVDRCERLVEPRLMGGSLGRHVDQLKVPEDLAVGKLDVTNPIIEAGKERSRLGFHDREIDVGARERADRGHRLPAGHDNNLNPAIDFDSLQGRTEKPVGALELRPDGIREMLGVSIRLL